MQIRGVKLQAKKPWRPAVMGTFQSLRLAAQHAGISGIENTPAAERYGS